MARFCIITVQHYCPEAEVKGVLRRQEDADHAMRHAAEMKAGEVPACRRLQAMIRQWHVDGLGG